ncbi:MAG: ABC transporter ATP-binding protein [bacterium]
MKKDIKEYFWEEKKDLVPALISTLISLVIGILKPYYAAKLVVSITNFNIENICMYSIIIFALFFVNEIIYTINIYFATKFESKVTYELKKDYSTTILGMQAQSFDKVGIGYFMERIDEDIDEMVSTITYGIKYFIPNVITSSGVIIFIFIINYKIGLLFMFYSIIKYLFHHYGYKKVIANEKKVKIVNEYNINTFSEIIRAVRDIKLLNLENKMKNKVTDIFTESRDIRLKNRIDIGSLDIKLNFLEGFLKLCVNLFCILLILNNELSPENFLIIYLYTEEGTLFVKNILALKNDYIKIKLNMNRLEEINNREVFIPEAFGKIDKKITGKIEVKNLSFSYDNKHNVIDNINFEIKPNENIGFVGKSGQGKTTIFNLLSKLYTCESGSIYFDDVDINDFTENSIRSNISVISQSPYIFNTTIKENLLMVKENATFEEILEKCKLVSLHDFIISLEDGYDTNIGENGIKLSGGQKQRLAIARALLKDSEIILLDEATSALDNETQEYILNSIKDISSSYTILIIAHRLSTIKDCDRIIVIDEGTISGIGTHKELIKNNEVYKRLYKKEFK